MDLISQGGPVMWPLLALSVAALAVMVERLFAFAALRLPGDAVQDTLLAAARDGNPEPALAELRAASPLLEPLGRALFGPGDAAQRERVALVALEDVLDRLERRLPVLAATARVAPLLGLLGTVLGMISTFSRLASAPGAIDLTTLADGIWQALITTAAGLFLAIPALLAHQCFLRRSSRAGAAMQRLANLVLAQAPQGTGR